MKTWFVTKELELQGLVDKLQELEADSHTIFQVLQQSGYFVIISYTTA